MKTMEKPKDQPSKPFDRDTLITPDLMDYADAWAMRFRFCGVPLEDLKQEAYYGLCLARTQFDPTQGASFKTYATFIIRRNLCSAVERYGCPMRIPKEEREAVKFLSLDRGFDEEEGDRMGFQLADAAWNGDMYSGMNGSWGSDVNGSLSSDVNGSWGSDVNGSLSSEANGSWDLETRSPLLDEPDNEEDCREVEGVVKELLSILTPREQQVVELLCGLKGDPLSTSAVGKEIQVSPARVRQIFQVALKKMELQYISRQASNDDPDHHHNYNYNKETTYEYSK
ncbi:MAG: sigma-70 family RNA polymerase sigma factor [Parabacteroides sp.]|nr:sigma-70 family RNA polymerase sigma factor [Parabacteroides sp.]